MTHGIRGNRIAQRAGTLLRAVRRAIAPVRVVRYGLAIVAIGVASLGLSTSAQHAPAPPGATPSSGPSCPLPLGEQVKAVKAFGEMLPVFRHPRCLNCHGGVDPLSDKQHPGADQLVPEIDRMTARERYEEQCQMCHDGLKGWTIPGEALFFVGKDDEQMCMQMKGFGLTADKFVSHIHDDQGGIQFIATGFAGDRALGEGLKDYGLVAQKAPGTQSELTAKARKWVAAMGGKYVGSPECGCVMPKIKLRIRHRSKYDPAHPSFLAGWVGFEGDVGFDVTLVPQEGFAGRYRGEASLVRSMKVQFAARGCIGTASQTEHWRFDAEVDQTSATMKLVFGFTTSAESGAAECNDRGTISRPQINPNLFHDLEEVEMPLDNGVTKEETLKEEHGRAQEWLVVKVVAVPMK